MAEYKCGDCFYADLCEEYEILDGFNRDNPAYCSMFLNSDDVAPVRHARWKVNKLGYLVCTHCGWVRYGIPLVEHYPYCPSCGFRMDG